MFWGNSDNNQVFVAKKGGENNSRFKVTEHRNYFQKALDDIRLLRIHPFVYQVINTVSGCLYLSVTL